MEINCLDEVKNNEVKYKQMLIMIIQRCISSCVYVWADKWKSVMVIETKIGEKEK